MKQETKIALCLPLVVLCVVLVIAGLNHLALPSRVPYIESVRRCAALPGFRPEVERVNSIIRHFRALNRRWWLDWAIPDGWEDVPLIEPGAPWPNLYARPAVPLADAPRVLASAPVGDTAP